jgi:hypothetical protein
VYKRQQLAGIRETHQAIKDNALTEVATRRNERKSERLLVIKKQPKHAYDGMGNRHKLDTPNTLLAKEATRKLALDIMYNEFSYYPYDTLFLQLSDHTKVFITDGFGVVSKAREEIENIPNRKSFPDYFVIASIVYPASQLMQTARQKDKSVIKIDFDFTKYSEFLQATAASAVGNRDVMSSIWCIMAATGCRANEILTDWCVVENKYLKYKTPKVPLTSENLSISLLPIDTLLKLRSNITQLTQPKLAKIIATQHFQFIQQFPMISDQPPRFTRDIYQCLVYNTMLKFGVVTATQMTNYVGHRNIDSGTFVGYTAIDIASGIVVNEFIELAKFLKFI